MRKLPNVPLSPCPAAYAQLVAQGFDTVQEAFALQLSPAFIELLKSTQLAAAELSDNMDASVECNLNGQRFKAHATGARGGFRWRLENDDILILISSPRRDWSISVRYLSAGLWEHGLDALRNRVLEALRPYTRRRTADFIRVTRADNCFDFFSPTFTQEFLPGIAENVVLHSSSKSQVAGKFDSWSRGPRGETLTIGSKRSLEVQLYDKTREITEASGKTWIYPLWLQNLGFDPWGQGRPRDVWRLECRFTKGFLKERNIRRSHELKLQLAELITEALYTRRLTHPYQSDGHRHRWPLHPLWSEAVRQFNADGMLPIGRKITGRRNELLENREVAFAGSLRSASVLKSGEFNKDNVISFFERALARIESDPRHRQKLDAARSRYVDLDEAR